MVDGRQLPPRGAVEDNMHHREIPRTLTLALAQLKSAINPGEEHGRGSRRQRDYKYLLEVRAFGNQRDHARSVFSLKSGFLVRIRERKMIM